MQIESDLPRPSRAQTVKVTLSGNKRQNHTRKVTHLETFSHQFGSHPKHMSQMRIPRFSTTPQRLRSTLQPHAAALVQAFPRNPIFAYSTNRILTTLIPVAWGLFQQSMRAALEFLEVLCFSLVDCACDMATQNHFSLPLTIPCEISGNRIIEPTIGRPSAAGVGGGLSAAAKRCHRGEDKNGELTSAKPGEV